MRKHGENDQGCTGDSALSQVLDDMTVGRKQQSAVDRDGVSAVSLSKQEFLSIVDNSSRKNTPELQTENRSPASPSGPDRAGPKSTNRGPEQGMTVEQFRSYLEQVSLSDPKEVNAILDRLIREADAVQESVRVKTQILFDRLEGQSFGSLGSNKAVTSKIRDLLNRLHRRVACTKEDCGAPAIVCCFSPARMEEGAFQFQHRIEGQLKSHLASPGLPAQKLILPAPDLRRKIK